MIYVPNYNSSSCVYVLDKDTIRVFESQPIDSVLVNYTDYYVNSHYLSKNDSIVYSGVVPTCLSSNSYTNDFFYRNDLDSILVIFFIITIVCIYFPYKIFSRMFGRWLKV